MLESALRNPIDTPSIEVTMFCIRCARNMRCECTFTYLKFNVHSLKRLICKVALKARIPGSSYFVPPVLNPQRYRWWYAATHSPSRRVAN